MKRHAHVGFCGGCSPIVMVVSGNGRTVTYRFSNQKDALEYAKKINKGRKVKT